MHAARVALAAFVIVALTASGVSAGRRVTVTRATISASGVTRLSDLFALAGSWSPATNDGYTFSPTPRGLSLPRDTQWTILLNGQTLDVSTFDANPLDAVPVALAEIDSVVFGDDAAPGAAWDSGRGRVEIFALRPVSGWRAGGAVGSARWVGDVGAIRFTPDAPRGSDTVGPDASFWALRGSARGYVALSGNLEQHPFVDPSMRRRSMSLRAGLRTSHSWHEAIATAMDAPDYIHYSEPFGRGVRADQRALLAGVSGGLQLNGAWRTRYRVAGSENRLSQSADDPVFADTWTTRRGRGGIDVERRVSRSRVGAFAALEHREVNTAGALTRNDDTFARTGAYWERRAGGAWILSADAAGTFAQGDGAATIGAGADWVVRTADTLRTRVRVSQRLFAEDDNLWLWSARGADLLANGGVAFSIDAPVTRTTVSSVDVGWTSTGVMGGLDVDLGLRRFDDAYVDQHTFALNPVACVFESPVNVVTGQTGHVAVVRTRLWHTLGNHSWGDFSWVYHESFNGDPALGTRWQTIPRNRLTYTIYARPSPAWGFHLRLAHISSTLWTDYAGVDGTVCDAGEGPFTVHSQLRGATTLDAGVQVTGFRHATLDVGARNLFNTPVRYHPAGALQALTVYAQFVLNWETL